MDKPSGGLSGAVIHVMDTLGAPGAGIASAWDSIIPIPPSEIVLPLVGFSASAGSMNLYVAILATTVGSVAGGLVLYAVGALIGPARIRALVNRLPLLRTHDLDVAEAWFARHGAAMVFLGRMVPGIRTYISVPAGLERMAIGTFVFLTAAGSLIWNTALVLAGYFLGQNWHSVDDYFGWATKVVVIALVALLAVAIALRIRSDRSAPRHRADRI